MSDQLARSDLETAVRSELLAYLQAGEINPAAVTDALAPDSDTMAEWSRLQRLHFCLAEPVIEFCRAVWDELRQVKTVTNPERTEYRGEVRGKVDWNRTIQSRADTGFADRSQFVCVTPIAEYDIAENRVLKRLLWEVDRTVDALRDIDQSWRHDRWSETNLDRFQRRFRRNVHLGRMPDGDRCTVTERDIQTAQQARSNMYRTAARWLSALQQLRDGNYSPPDVQRVLAETLVTPATDARLLELYATFNIIQDLTSVAPDLVLQPIETGDGPIAQLSDPATDLWVDVYHDQHGSLAFHEPITPNIRAALPTDPSYFRDHVTAQQTYQRVAARLSDATPQPALYSGRPDVVVEFRDSPEGPPMAVVLGEVKETARGNLFRDGLQELISYWHHGRVEQGGMRLASPEGPVTLGFVMTNGVNARHQSGPCQHLNAGESFSNVLEPLRRLGVIG